jgi:hypothetical protein
MIILGIVYYRAYNIRLEEKRPCELVSNLHIRLPRIFCDFHVILRQASLLHFLRWSFFPKVNGTAVGKHPCGLLTSLWGLPSKKRTPLLTGGRPWNAALFTEDAANVEEHFPRDFCTAACRVHPPSMPSARFSTGSSRTVRCFCCCPFFNPS